MSDIFKELAAVNPTTLHEARGQAHGIAPRVRPTIRLLNCQELDSRDEDAKPPARLRVDPPDHLGPAESRDDAPDALDKSAISELSREVIHGMTHDELVRMILAGELRFLQEAGHCSKLSRYDRDTLTRLAFLARRRCQHCDS